MAVRWMISPSGIATTDICGDGLPENAAILSGKCSGSNVARVAETATAVSTVLHGLAMSHGPNCFERVVLTMWTQDELGLPNRAECAWIPSEGSDAWVECVKDMHAKLLMSA